MKLTQTQVTDGIYEHIRLAIVAAGYLPDFPSFATDAEYQAAKLNITNAGKQVIELFSTGNYTSRGKKDTNNIILSRAVPLPAQTGIGKELVFTDNNDGRFKKEITPQTKYDISYSISYNTSSDEYAEIIETILTNALQVRTFIKARHPNGDPVADVIVDGVKDRAGFWFMHRGFVDTSGKDFIEKQLKFLAVNIDLIGMINLGTVAELTEFDFGMTSNITDPAGENTKDDLGQVKLDIEIQDE